ncbi:YiiX/YebB-like N1pC/P60 family cysteine hydrolase [Aliivibrio sifiae]|uniref:YiiX/YebB-like N1pC/P60 family cysteine hydrolase n=1 Tax=Aliivibrio sifiae TaxID=566293 RepID=UPI003D0DA7EF
MLKINHTKLQAGDIILTRSQLGLNSAIIRLGTWGSFSHASLYLGEGSYMDSTPEGVHSGNLYRLIFAHSSYVKALRLKDEYITQDIIKNATNYVRSKYSQEYSKTHALMSVPWAKAKGADTKNRAFCSRLVASAFTSAGLNIVDNPNFASPEDLNQSSYFFEVNNITEPANEIELNAPFEKGHILEQQKNITSKLFKSFRHASGKDIQTFEQAILATIEQTSIDSVFTNTITDSGYFELKDQAFLTVPWIKNPVTFLMQGNFLDIDDFNNRVQRELNSIAYNLERYEDQKNSFWLLNQEFPNNKFISKLLSFYNELVQEYKIAVLLFNGMLDSPIAKQFATLINRN